MFKETNRRKRLLWVMLPEDSHQPWQGGQIEHCHVVEVERWKIWKITSSTPVTKKEQRIKMTWIYLFFFLIANPQCHTLFSNVPTTKFLKTLWPTEDSTLKILSNRRFIHSYLYNQSSNILVLVKLILIWM